MPPKRPKRDSRPGVDRAGRTPLHHAAVDGDRAAVEQLLRDGADPSARDDDNNTPLHFAAQGWHVEVADILIRAGAEVDAIDDHGNTPLCRAVFESRGRGDLIALLCASGADPLRTNQHGASPLSLARTISNFDVAQFFADLP